MKGVEQYMVHPVVWCITSTPKHPVKNRSGTIWYAVTGVLLVLIAIVWISAAVFLPVFKISGHAMSPTLSDGAIVMSTGPGQIEPGDVVIVRVNGQNVVRRVIATGGSGVSVDAQGRVTVDDTPIHEPYLNGQFISGLTPFTGQVPENELFLLGDERQQAVDSRSSAMGYVPTGQVIGRVLLCLWPLNDLGLF